VAILARQGSLESARLALFHPIGFMLAQPLATPEAIVEAMPSPFAVEDKYDGIRAQAHVEGDEVRLFSRTLDDITRGYPEVVASLSGLGAGLVLDGELIAVDPEDRRRARPFAALQRRLGRKAPAAAVLDETPVAFVAYELLAVDHELVLDSSYDARRSRLLSLFWREEAAFVASSVLCFSPDEVEAAFARARAAGNEGLIAKDPSSPYTRVGAARAGSSSSVRSPRWTSS
jgi:DNA ligase-1